LLELFGLVVSDRNLQLQRATAGGTREVTAGDFASGHGAAPRG
jgi:hypothetical protein